MQPSPDAAKPKVSKAARRGDSREVLPEPIFHRMIALERKRAERAGRGFLLILLDGEKLFRHSQVAMTGTADSISAATRETDLVGWHRERAVLGIILTEIGTSEKAALRGAMSEALHFALQAELGSSQAEQIRISFHFFPGETPGHKGGDWTDRELYPDLKRENKARTLALLAKRAMDIAGSLTALLVLSPILAVIAVAIRLTSKGPVLFRQTRVGQYGQHFQFLKFRSMRIDSDPKIHQEFIKEFILGSSRQAASGQGNAGVYKITQDPRVTAVGRVLRKASLDELPQFWNVLVGEMSLVGPRPPIPYELEAYKTWHRRRVLEVKPGLTGLWQIYGRSRTTFEEMVRMDLRYARTWSLLLDLKILFRTPLALLSGEGAY